MAMIAMTTSNSTSVKPAKRFLFRIPAKYLDEDSSESNACQYGSRGEERLLKLVIACVAMEDDGNSLG